MGFTPFPYGVTSMGIPQIGEELPSTTQGSYFFLNNAHSNTSDSNNGLDRDHPLATLAAAVGKCSDALGDVIVVGEGHAETLAATVDFTTSKDHIRVIGLGYGRARPTFTNSIDDDGIDLNGANIQFWNCIFTQATVALTAGQSMVTVGGADNGFYNCEFIFPAVALFGIDIESTGARLTVKDCVFRVTADGPDCAIQGEAANAGLIVDGCYFDGESATNAWDLGDIESGHAMTNIRITNNLFVYMAASIGGVQITAAATGIIADNRFAGGTLAEMLDPGSCICIANYEADAIDESGILFPTTTAS